MPALHVLQRVVSGVAVPLLKSADSVKLRDMFS